MPVHLFFKFFLEVLRHYLEKGNAKIVQEVLLQLLALAFLGFNNIFFAIKHRYDGYANKKKAETLMVFSPNPSSL